MPGPTNADFEASLRFRDLATGKFIKATKTQIDSIKKLGLNINQQGKVISASAKKYSNDYTAGSRKMRLGTSGLRRELGRLRNQLLLVTFAFHLFTRVLKPTISLAMKQEFAERKLEAAFVGSGLATKKQVQNLKALANQLQGTTMFGNEEIINAQAMLATFKLNAGQVEQLTERMLDMATAVTDVSGKEANLQSIAIALGKGVTGNIGVLSRYGVVLSETAKKSGDFNLIMKELDENFKGIAEAMRTTFMGQMKMSGNVVGDFQKELGFVITKSKVLIAIMEIFREDLIKTTEKLKDSREKTDAFANGWMRVATYIIAVSGTLRIMWRAMGQGTRVIVLFLAKLAELATVFPELEGGMKTFADNLFGFDTAIFSKLRKNTEEFHETMKEFSELTKGDLVTGAEDINAVWDEMADSVENIMNKMAEFGNINTEIFDKLKMSTEEAIEAMEVMEEVNKGIFVSMKNAFSTLFYDAIVDKQKSFGEKMLAMWDGFSKSIIKMISEIAAKMLIISMFPGAAGYLGVTMKKGHQGGFVTDKGIKRYHRGGEVGAILKTGEGVVNETGMASLGRGGLERLNRGQGGGGSVTNYYLIDAIDVKTFRQYLAENEDLFRDSVYSNIEENGSLRRLFRSGV